MQSFDFFPAKCNFSALQDAAFYVKSDKVLPKGSIAGISISHLGKQIHSESSTLNTNCKKWHLPISIDKQSFDESECGFLASCVLSIEGQGEKRLHTAFDCSANWTKHPRYGYLCDFPPNRQNMPETIEELLKFHINGLQYYDWQYRHEELVASQNEYQDILGRRLSLDTIAKLIKSAKIAGMACMPYLAIYGASLAYWKSHQDEALFDNEGNPILFHDFLGIMNPSPKSSWTKLLSSECEKTLKQLPFDGLHIDQYGEPQTAFDSNGNAVDIPGAFVDFINDQKNKFNNKSVVFNAVKNWPIKALSTSDQDFMYIEIWPPKVHYQDLIEIIHNAQQLSGNKPVVLALYIPAKRTANICLSNAVILAAGGTRIEIGENARYLSDPYFPKHQKMSPSLYNHLRRYYDFAVAYREWLQPSGQSVHQKKISAPKDVLVLTNDKGKKKIIHLINFNKIDEKRWDRHHSAPDILRDFQVEIPSLGRVKSVSLASPDNRSPYSKSAHFSQTIDTIKIDIPRLKYWTMIIIETEEK